jgi:hypothetical protein
MPFHGRRCVLWLHRNAKLEEICKGAYVSDFNLRRAGFCCLQDTVNFPVHLKNFNMGQLRQLCKELRSDIVHTVSKTGGEHNESLLHASLNSVRT